MSSSESVETGSKHGSSHRWTWRTRAPILAVLLVGGLGGCGNGFSKIDRRVEQLLVEGSTTLGPEANRPQYGWTNAGETQRSTNELANERPATFNPPSSEISFTPLQEAETAIQRLNAVENDDQQPLRLDLPTSVSTATRSSREYVFAQEEYVLAALRLLIERHLWGPRFFDDVSAVIVGDADAGLYDTSLRLVNEFTVTQRLPYGGEISATALARATEDLHHRVAGEEVDDAEVLLEANIPLLRGAGITAREDRIQAERDLIYAAREFENFRRDFAIDIIEDFLNLVVLQQAVANAERQVESLRQVEARELSLYEAGRTPRFQAALAEQATVRARDDLNSRRENYRLAVDRFKLRLSIPIEQPVVIVPTDLNLPIPQVDMDEAVRWAMQLRLDLQTQRDQVVDADRQVYNARNALLPDLDVAASFGLPSDPLRRRAALRLDPDESFFSAGVTFGLPLDREIERLGVRRAQIALERERRDLDLLRDNITIAVRSAARDIDLAIFSLQIQERSIEIGLQRIASIEAAPDRASARDAAEAADELAEARDARDSARRDLLVAVLRYLRETGQLRIDDNGYIRPLNGMEINGVRPESIPAPASP